jgi:hypothetical protein
MDKKIVPSSEDRSGLHACLIIFLEAPVPSPPEPSPPEPPAPCPKPGPEPLPPEPQCKNKKCKKGIKIGIGNGINKDKKIVQESTHKIIVGKPQGLSNQQAIIVLKGGVKLK